MIDITLKRSFGMGDVVYCPYLSDKAFILFTKPDVNGVFLTHRNTEYWFTTDGYPEDKYQMNQSSAYRAPMLFEVNSYSSGLLTRLLGKSFIANPVVPLYAIIIPNSEDEGVFDKFKCYGLLGRMYHDVSGGEYTLDSLLENDVILSPNSQKMESLSLFSQKVVCIGKYNISELGRRNLLTK